MVRDEKNREAASWRSRLFMIQMPGAIPIGGGRVCEKIVDPPDQRHRWSIAGDRFESRAKGLTRLVPAPCAIGGKSFRISLQQHRLRCRQFVRAPDDLEHRPGTGLADDPQ